MNVCFLLNSSLFFLILSFTTAIENGDDMIVKNNNGGFLFYMPKVLHTNKNQSVCLSLHETTIPAKVVIDLKWKEKHFYTIRNLDSGHSCFDMYVPNLEIKESQYISVKVQVQVNGVVQSAHNQDPILIYPNNLVKTFLDTDRGIYKPGDKVTFRVLVINDQLLPVNSKISEIKLKNPLDITVHVWENVQPENGLLNLHYQMVPESVTGKWKIEIPGATSKTFDVFGYVLPRFKIDLFYPKVIYYNANHIKIKVCSRYSYGRPVKGFSLIKISDSHNNMQSFHDLKELENGCSTYNVTAEQLSLDKIKQKYSLYDPQIQIHITSTVTEKGTNRIDITYGKIYINLKPYSIKFVSSPIFRPGLPYKGKIKLSNVNVDLSKEVVQICYNVAIKKSWNYMNSEHCGNFTVNAEDKSLEFSVLPLKSNIIQIYFHAGSLNNTGVGGSFLAVRLFSQSNSYIFIEENILKKEDNDCRPLQQFTVFYTTDKLKGKENFTLYYMIKFQNQIHKLRKINHQVKKNNQNNYFNELKNIIGEKHKYTKPSAGIDSFVIKFKIEKTILLKYELLVYYVTDSGETVAATKTVNIEPCPLKVEAKWHQKQMVPGSIARLNIKTSSRALCSVTAVDKSTNFFYNKHKYVNFITMLKTLSEGMDSAESGRKSCIMPSKKLNQALSYEPINTMWDLRRKKRHVYSFSEDYDAYDVFQNFGSIVITNLKIVTKPCYTGPMLKNHQEEVVPQFLVDADGMYENENEEDTVKLRSQFPETWLWELVPVSESVEIKRYLPHSITNWLTNVLCVSDQEGVGISQETEISSFQSFFVEALTPYSIKKDENFYLYVHVSNYLNHRFPIRIAVRISEGLDVANPNVILTKSFCINENDTVTQIFHLTGTTMGNANITVIAESDNQYPDQCGPETIVSKRDVVLKTVKVQPEGYPVTKTKSALLCASDSQAFSNVSWCVSTPPDIVPDTSKVKITINGDLLAKTVDNLEELLDIPTGCGEQIMATMAPNLYILRYLNTTNSLKFSTRHRIIRNLKIGYQRILNYAHKDGSFSAFGYHDPSGSMFLTTFVVRTLQEAKEFIYVDQRVIDKAVEWIFKHQLENGCFNTMYHVFQDMGGTSKENSTAGLTAYVILSLMEAGITIPKYVKTNAKFCIRSQHDPDRYTLALSCYALFKIQWFSEAERMLKKLIDLANQQDNLMWWSNNKDNESTATDIEITGYVLLSLLHYNTSDNLAHAHSVTRWLSTKYGANGGFQSTQDTVVALYSVAKYSKMISSATLNLTVNTDINGRMQNINLKRSDRLKSKDYNVESDHSDINISVHGEGCVLAQVVQSYYLKNVPKSEAFKLAMDVSPVSNVDQCSIASLSPCLAYTGIDGLSNMAVMEVTLPSGYEADRSSLYKLVEPENLSKVKMFEEIKDKINFYFAKLDKQLICFSFNINENTLVGGRKESLIKLYDYYRPEFEVLQFYKVNDICKPNNISELPEIPKTSESNNTIPEFTSAELDNDNDTIMGEEVLPFKNVSKRSIDGKKENITSGLNPDFVDKTTDTEFSNCNEQNFPFYTPRDSRKVKTKREIKSNENIKTNLKKRQTNKSRIENNKLNNDFVNLDIDMAMPEGMEANVPVYVKPTSAELKNMSSY